MDKYKITIDSWNKVALEYQETFMHLPIYNDTYDNFCNLVKQNANIFEIGCGPGNITKYISVKRPDFKIKAIDVSAEMISLAKQNKMPADFEQMDCREIDNINEIYDGIICGFCLPYLSKTDCEKLFKNVNKLLHAGGFFYVSTIEGDYEKSGFETGSSGQHKMFVYYYPENYLLELLSKHNFSLISVYRKQFTRKDATVSTHLIFIAKKS